MTRLSMSACLAVLAALAATAPAADAVAPGSGVRGTVDLSWGNISGGPITAWSGSAHLTFDPSAAGRQETLAAISDPRLGEPSRPPYAPQVQAARVTSLVSDKTETVTCLGDDGEGNPIEYPAPWSSSVASIADGRVAFEITPPHLDLLTGRGDVALDPYLAPSSSGWWAADRFALPGRFTGGGAWPCPGDGAAADRLPRILALNGQGAVPRPLTDWLDDDSRSLAWPVRRTRSGWRVMISTAQRPTFSDSPFGPQDTQQMDVRIGSDVYLAGSLADLQAWCRVPSELIARAKTSRAAVRLARRAGLRARYAGVKRVATLRAPKFVVTGRIGMGRGTCGRGAYKVWRYEPRR